MMSRGMDSFASTSRVLGTRAELFGEPLGHLPFGTLGQMLITASQNRGDDIAHVCQSGKYIEYSYGDLLDDALRILSGLRTLGIKSGHRVVVQLSDPRDLLAAIWSCLLGGIVPVPTTPTPPAGSGLSRYALLESIKTVAETNWAITSVESLRRHEMAVDFNAADSSDVALLMLTSGSTGLPKAVQLTHRNIISRCVATTATRSMSSNSRTMNWMPLDHVGGLVMFHLRDVFLGCRQIHAPMDWVLANPLRWIDILSAQTCDTTWASNFAFGIVADRRLEAASRKWDLRNLRYIMNGGEPINSESVKRFVEMLTPHGLPKCAVHPGWGMSETSSGVVDTCLNVEDLRVGTRFVSVGKPHPGVFLRVVDDAGSVVDEGQVGLVQVSGEPIAKAYFANEPQNRLSFTDDGWFKSGDLAFIGGGNLTITGRANDLIVSGGVEFYAHEVEAAVEELAFVEPSFTVCLLVDGLVSIAYHNRDCSADDSDNVSAIKMHIFDKFGFSPTQVISLDKAEVPKTGIGKLKRSQLAFRLSSGGSAMQLAILQLIRLKGGPLFQDIVQASVDDVETVLPVLEDEGWCEESDGRYRLTNAGKVRLASLLEDERMQVDVPSIKKLYADFKPHNFKVKSLVTAWQIRENEINDHADSVYDESQKLRLAAEFNEFAPLLSEFTSLAARLRPYSFRFERALERLQAGDDRWFSAALIDSFHTVWFELHEDLLGLAEISRSDEDLAGSA